MTAVSDSPRFSTWAADSSNRTAPSSNCFDFLPGAEPSLPLLASSPPLPPFRSDDCLADSALDLFGDGGSETFHSEQQPSSPFPSLSVWSSGRSSGDSVHSALAGPPSPDVSARDVSPVPLSTAAAVAAVSRPRFISRKVACQVCHFAKVRCDGGRPCERCIRHSHTAHCSDRPSRKGQKRKRPAPQQPAHTQPPLDYIDRHTALAADNSPHESSMHDAAAPITMSNCSVTVRSTARRIPPHLSLPFAARHQPVDAARLSSSFVSGHLRWLSSLSAADLTSLLCRMHLRDKLIQGVWMAQLLTPADLLTLSHSVPLSRTWWQHYFQPACHQLLLDCHARDPLPFERAAVRRHCHTHSHGPAEAHRRRECDGTACFGFCGFLDTLIEAAECSISWQRSRLLAMADQPNAPSQPFIAIRRLHDETLARKQEALVDALCTQMARDMSLTAIRPGSTQSTAVAAAARPTATHTTACECGAVVVSVAERPSLPVQRVEVAMSVQCNAAFERLLGFQQSEVRALFVSAGEKALYGLVSEDDWPALLQLDKAIKLGRADEGRLVVSAVDRRRGTVRCVLHVQSEFDRNGKPVVTYWSFTPLPDGFSGSGRDSGRQNCSPQRQWM